MGDSGCARERLCKQARRAGVGGCVRLVNALVAMCADTNEKRLKMWWRKKKKRGKKYTRNSVLLSIFEVGFESVTEALGVFHKLFLLLFHYLTNKYRQPFSSTYFTATVFVCTGTFFFFLNLLMYPLTRLFWCWYFLKTVLTVFSSSLMALATSLRMTRTSESMLERKKKKYREIFKSVCFYQALIPWNYSPLIQLVVSPFFPLFSQTRSHLQLSFSVSLSLPLPSHALEICRFITLIS